MNKYILTLISVCFLSITNQAQSDINVCDKQFESGEYFTALQGYLNASRDNKNCIKVARCYNALGIEHKAYKWYQMSKAYNNVDNSFALEIGKSEMQSGNYELALETLSTANSDNTDIDHYIDMINNVPFIINNDGSKNEALSLNKNTLANEFGVIFHNDMLYYNTDIKNVNLDAEALAKLNKSAGSILCDQYNVPLLKGIASKTNISPISISFSNKIAYTQYNRNCQSFTSRRIENSIFIGILGGEDIKDIKAFPFNEVGISNTDPLLSDDGNTLFFASNRPGGFGGFDLYKSELIGGQWTTPQNLGSTINTKGNEITPHLDQQNNIFFASDYHFGLGGYDIFKGSWFNGDWLNVTNMGLGINSSSNDYYPCINHITQDLFFTSSRASGQGGEDVYKAQVPRRDVVINFNGTPIAHPVSEVVYTKPISTTKEIVQPIALEGDIPPAIFIGDYKPRVNDKIETIRSKSNNSVASNNSDIVKISTEIYLPLQNEVASIVPPPAFKIPDFSSEEKTNKTLVSYKGARLVSIGEVITKKMPSVYFIQVGAFYTGNTAMDKFKGLSSLGNIYKVFAGSAVKVRLGYFQDRSDASGVLSRVKSMGYNDAFIVNEDLNTNTMELIYSNFEANSENNSISGKNFEYNKPLDKTSSQQYKVRLASYEDPIWFETAKVKDLGQLEQWSKGSWTIFILSGYNNFEEAELARISAVNRGYADAEVVIDNEGIIERLKKN